MTSKRRSVRNVESTLSWDPHPDFPSAILNFSYKCTSAGLSSFTLVRLSVANALMRFCDPSQIIERQPTQWKRLLEFFSRQNADGIVRER